MPGVVAASTSPGPAPQGQKKLLICQGTPSDINFIFSIHLAASCPVCFPPLLQVKLRIMLNVPIIQPSLGCVQDRIDFRCELCLFDFSFLFLIQ